jgi:hypothetical protein
MKRRTTAIACFALAAALAAWTARGSATGDDHPRSPAERLLGPIADLAATAQWVRVDDAASQGRDELAEARAEIALALAPGDAAGWIYWANHLIYDRAARLREPDPIARERWVRAGLDVLDRGEAASRAPGRVAFKRAVVFLSFSQAEDADRPLPITREGALREALRAFERAAEHGEPLAAEMVKALREEAGQ